MAFVENKIEIPKEWMHDPTLQNKTGNTVAMMFVMQRRVPPDYWHHDPKL